MKRLIIKLGIFCLNIMYSFIKILPTQNKITMISRQSNVPTTDMILLKESFNKEIPNYKIVLLPKKLENKIAYIFNMLLQMYHIATSKVVILDSYCICISILKHKKSLKVIQMWHAVGCMKKFGYAAIGTNEGHSLKTAELMKMHKNYDYLLISSKNFQNDYLEGFRCNENQILEMPLPRVDLLLDEAYKSNKKKEILKKIPELKKKKNILYCHTFRKDESNSLKYINKLINEIDLNKYNILYKPHPLSKIELNNTNVIKDFNDTYEALLVTDYVICDYSSIIYEVGLLNLPIYIYAYDWKEYKNKRELNFDIEHEIPTLFTDDPKKIITAINNNEFNFNAYSKFVSKNITLPENTTCTKQIVDFIKKII